jgi:hypothetical protein
MSEGVMFGRKPKLTHHQRQEAIARRSRRNHRRDRKELQRSPQHDLAIDLTTSATLWPLPAILAAPSIGAPDRQHAEDRSCRRPYQQTRRPLEFAKPFLASQADPAGEAALVSGCSACRLANAPPQPREPVLEPVGEVAVGNMHKHARIPIIRDFSSESLGQCRYRLRSRAELTYLTHPLDLLHSVMPHSDRRCCVANQD